MKSITDQDSKQFFDVIQRHNAKIPRIREEHKYLYELRKEFVSLFPIESITEIELNLYVHGRRYIDEIESFCYWLEHKLSLLGKVGGSQNWQYGVYYADVGKSGKKDYHYTAKYGESLETAFTNVKNEIYNLLKAGERKDFDFIAGSKIPNKFKGKLLSTYFPDLYLNIFDPLYLQEIITHFNLDIIDINSKEPIYQQLHLLKFKNSNSQMSAWTVDEFAAFLNNEWWENYGNKSSAKDDDDNDNIKFPSLDQVNPDFVTEINQADLAEAKDKEKSKKKFNYIKRQKALKRYGNRGELIVLKAERLWLLKNSLDINKLSHVAELDDTAGYDIESLNLDSTKKIIEVKATTRKAERIEFFLSAPELKFAKECLSYFIYIVFEVHTTNPKIYILQNPFNPENTKTKLVPTNYLVNISQ